jgi:hypothetical protein
MRHTDHSEEALRAAWARRRRHGWPLSYDEAMTDPLYSRLVRIEAEHHAIAQRARRGERRPMPATLVELKPHRELDRKQLASGEREDD